MKSRDTSRAAYEAELSEATLVGARIIRAIGSGVPVTVQVMALAGVAAAAVNHADHPQSVEDLFKGTFDSALDLLDVDS